MNRNIYIICIVAVAVIVLQSNKFYSPNVSLIHVKHKTLIPEGITVHPKSGKVYLSSLHLNKIVSVSKNGKVSDLITSGQEGFMGGLGMKFTFDGQILYACTADGKGKTKLFAIDVRNKKIINQYTDTTARFLNDLIILSDSRIFITDTELGAVFLLKKDSLDLWLKDEKLKWANGIAVSTGEKYLFVASGRYGLQRIDIASKTITSATQDKRTDYAIDGLVYHSNTLYAVIGWPQDKINDHRILRYYLDDQQNFSHADTLVIGQPYLSCPTTLAIHNQKLYVLGNTNLGIYNRHQQNTANIIDSLSFPIISKFPI